MLELAEASTFDDSPHRVSAEHNISVALTKASVLDPSKTGPGADGEKADFARTMAQLASGYSQLGADGLAANALHVAGSYSNDYGFDYASSLFLAGAPDQALTAFKGALDAKPDDTNGAVTAGFFYLMAGDPLRATKLLRDAATRGTSHEVHLYGAVYLVLAAQMQRGDPRRAIEGLPAEPNNPWPADLRDALILDSTRHLDIAVRADKLAFQDRLCEALFYVGFSREIDHKDDQAEHFYRAALDTRATGTRAYAAARLRLSDLLAGNRKLKVLTPRNLS